MYCLPICTKSKTWKKCSSNPYRVNSSHHNRPAPQNKPKRSSADKPLVLVQMQSHIRYLTLICNPPQTVPSPPTLGTAVPGQSVVGDVPDHTSLGGMPQHPSNPHPLALQSAIAERAVAKTFHGRPGRGAPAAMEYCHICRFCPQRCGCSFATDL